MNTYYVRNDFDLQPSYEENLNNSSGDIGNDKLITNESDKKEDKSTSDQTLPNEKNNSDNNNNNMKPVFRRSIPTLDRFSNTSFRNIYRLKSILIGNVNVGKTSILNRFLVNKFSNEYSSSIGVEFKVKSIPINENTTADLQIWDTCGQEKFRTITRQYYQNSNAVILVFDLTTKSSFDDVLSWINDIKEFGPKDCLIIIVGNKLDLYNQRCISFEQSVDLAKKLDMDYFEVSAKTGQGVKFMFDILVRSLVKQVEESFHKEGFDKYDIRNSSSLIEVKKLKVGKTNSGCCK